MSTWQRKNTASGQPARIQKTPKYLVENLQSKWTGRKPIKKHSAGYLLSIHLVRMKTRLAYMYNSDDTHGSDEKPVRWLCSRRSQCPPTKS